jgi:uncharacterized cupredoxin-like copper-binding protein
MRARALAFVLACAALAAVGAFAVAGASAAPAANKAITVKQKEYSITVSPGTLKHGVTYTVKVMNVGKLSHSLLFDGDGLHDRGIHNAHKIAPGKSATFTLKIPKKGTVDVYCAIPGHKALGMDRHIKVS